MKEGGGDRGEELPWWAHTTQGNENFLKIVESFSKIQQKDNCRQKQDHFYVRYGDIKCILLVLKGKVDWIVKSEP